MNENVKYVTIAACDEGAVSQVEWREGDGVPCGELGGGRGGGGGAPRAVPQHHAAVVAAS